MMCSTPDADHPTIFHVTHWKAGSQWVRSVLKHAAPKRFTQPRPAGADPLGGPVVPGGVYSPVYAPHPRPAGADPLGRPGVPGAVYSPVYAPHSRFQAVVPESLNQRTFVVLRD